MKETDDLRIIHREYILSPEFQQLANRIKIAADNRCQICYQSSDHISLQAHHRTYDRLGDELPGDLTALCAECHDLFTRYDKLAEFGGKQSFLSRDIRSVSDILEKDTDKDNLLYTGYPDLDKGIGGIEAPNLIVVASRPTMGKTSFVTNCAQNFGRRFNKSVLFFSLQEAGEQIVKRMLSMETRIEYNRLKTGNLEQFEIEILEKATDRYHSADIAIDDTYAATTEHIRMAIYRHLIDNHLDIVVIDGINLIQTPKPGRSRHQELALIATELKILAREFHLPFLITSQLGAAVNERQDKRPQLSDFAKEGGLDQLADLIIFIYRDEFYKHDETEKPNIAEFNFARNRHGPTYVADMYWHGALMAFRNLQRLETSL